MKRAVEEILKFNEERDWDQFHNPENLAKSISIEAGELLECFQWNNEYDKQHVCEELADVMNYCILMANKLGVDMEEILLMKLEQNQRIIAGNAQFTGIAAGRGVGFTTGLLLLRKGLGMRETPIRPHSWHCRMQSGYQYGGNRKRPPVWRRHRGSLRPRGRNLGGVEGMTGGCGSGCDPAIHTRRLRVYHRPRRLRMASRISIFFAARRFEPLNSMG